MNKRSADSSLEKINDAVLDPVVFGRMFGYGDLEILTASESGISRLRMLREADDFKRAMLDAKHELEYGAVGRAAVAVAAAPAAPPDPTRAAAPPASRRRVARHRPTSERARRPRRPRRRPPR